MRDRILVVNMNYLGDALLTTPALAALRSAYPEAQIDSIVGAGAAEVLQGNPDLDSVIIRKGGAGWGRLTELYRLLRREAYTTVIFLPPIPAYAIAAFLARTPRRIGQATPQMNPFLTERRTVSAVHLADRMLETMPTEIRPAKRQLYITVDSKALAAAAHLLKEAGLDRVRDLVALNMGATRPQKRWHADAFAGLLDTMPETSFVLIGAGKNDLALAQDVLSRTRRRNIVNLVGKTDFKTLAALLARCNALVSADSGPMHLATAVGTATVALFGSTDPLLTGPYDDRSLVLDAHLACAPCFKHPTCEGRYDCMRALTPENVALAVRSVSRKVGVSLPMAGG